MKKTLALLLAVVMAFALTACAGRSSEPENQAAQQVEPLNADEQLIQGNWKAYAIVESSSSARYLTGHEYGELILRADRTGSLAFSAGAEQAKEAVTWSHNGSDYKISYGTIGFMEYSEGDLWLLLQDNHTFLIFRRN